MHVGIAVTGAGSAGLELAHGAIIVDVAVGVATRSAGAGVVGICASRAYLCFAPVGWVVVFVEPPGLAFDGRAAL